MKIQVKAEVGDYVYMYPKFYTTPFKDGDRVKLLQIIHGYYLIDFEYDEEHIRNVCCGNYSLKKEENATYIICNKYLFEGHDTFYDEWDFEINQRM